MWSAITRRRRKRFLLRILEKCCNKKIIKENNSLKKTHTARGKPRSAKTITAAVLVVSFPRIMYSIPFLLSLRDIKLITAVPAMQANTVKLLRAHTTLAPIRWHIGSMRNELIPRTTYGDREMVNSITDEWLKCRAVKNRLLYRFLQSLVANQMHLHVHLDHRVPHADYLLLDLHGKLLFPSNLYQTERRGTKITARNKTTSKI